MPFPFSFLIILPISLSIFLYHNFPIITYLSNSFSLKGSENGMLMGLKITLLTTTILYDLIEPKLTPKIRVVFLID